MLKSLSVIYLLMAVIGFLGYFQFEKFSSSVFSFFYDIMGPYSIMLPIICVIFSVICWKINVNKSVADEDLETEDSYSKEIAKSKSLKHEYRNRFDAINYKTTINEQNGFNYYFSNALPIKDEGPIHRNDFSHLGTDFSSYFGEGEKSIYLPAKIIKLRGFDEYFSNEENFAIYKRRAANDIGRTYYGNKPGLVNQHLSKTTIISQETSKNQFENKSLEAKSDQKLVPQNSSIDLKHSKQSWSLPKTEYINRKGINYWENPTNIDNTHDEKIIKHENFKEQEYRYKKEEKELDNLFRQAAELVIMHNFVSPSFLQKRLRVSYSKVIRLINMLEESGIISKYKGNESRDILMTLEAFHLKYHK
ncbi:MAG: hypothetical protein GX351_02310 [Peptococcaceae bacterium]|nr:hypothetical protein [Peptococcaceae bacterium]